MRVYTVKYITGGQTILEFTNDYSVLFGSRNPNQIRIYNRGKLEQVIDGVRSYTVKEYDDQRTASALA